MGMYTGLRVKCVVKPQWREAIALLHSDFDTLVSGDPACDYDDRGSWSIVAEAYPDMPGVEEWQFEGRASFIPFGALAYMPDDFYRDVLSKEEQHDGSGSVFDFATGEWRFVCSLKNYNQEIPQFAIEVLFPICESVELCESLYEDYDDNWASQTRDWRRYAV